MIRLFTSLTLALALVCGTAVAQVAEDDYATEFFGTVATFNVDQPVPLEGEYGYWADNINQMIYDSTYLMQQVNAVRQRKGLPLLGDDVYLYATTNDTSTPDQVSYTFGFQWLTPDEAREILAGLDNLSDLLPGAEIVYTPLKSRFFDVSVYDLNDSLAFNDYGVQFSFAPGTGSRQMLNELSAAFKARFGDQTLVDSVYYSESAYNLDDSGSRMLSFQVQIEPSEEYNDQYDG